MSQLQKGDTAPQFSALNDTSESISLDQFKGQTVILYFYPKDDTPGCTAQACGFRDAFPAIAEKGATVLGVSPDSVASHEKFKKKYDLPFTLISDPDHEIAEAYGVWGEKSMYGRKYMGITRSHFVIDGAGKIVEAAYKVKAKDSPKDSMSNLG